MCVCAVCMLMISDFISSVVVHTVVKKYTADYDRTLIFNKVHHELNQASVSIVTADINT